MKGRLWSGRRGRELCRVNVSFEAPGGPWGCQYIDILLRPKKPSQVPLLHTNTNSSNSSVPAETGANGGGRHWKSLSCISFGPAWAYTLPRSLSAGHCRCCSLAFFPSFCCCCCCSCCWPVMSVSVRSNHRVSTRPTPTLPPSSGTPSPPLSLLPATIPPFLLLFTSDAEAERGR